MRTKSVFLASAAACCVVLASCGGGDESPTPTPTPTPTGTPTPTPTPTVIDFDFTKAFTVGTTGTAYSYAYFTPTGGTESWSDGSRRNGLSSFNYAVSPESAALIWPDTSTLTTFGAADLLSATANLRTYRKGTDGLTMWRPFTHILQVSYESTVPFNNGTVAGNLRSLRNSLFFNIVTTTAEITANLSYSGTPQVAGGTAGTSPAGVFSSPATTLTVAASDKKITGTIRIVENVGGSPVERAVLPISATVGAAGSFTGAIDDTANGFKGSFVGALAGPAREEVFLIFNVAHTDKREFIGSLIAD